VDIEAEIHVIKNMLSLINERRAHDAKEKEDLTNMVKDLAVSINRLNLTLKSIEGVQEGKTAVMKGVYTVFGGLIAVWIIWVTSTVVSNSNTIFLIKDNLDHQRGQTK